MNLIEPNVVRAFGICKLYFLNYIFKELKKYARKQEDKIKRYIILNVKPF